MFAGFGLFFVAWSFAQYQMGSAVRMGPGYFPAVLGGLLLVLGAVILLQSLVFDGPKVEAFHFKPLVYVSVSVLAYGYLMQPGGLAVATAAAVIIGAMAGNEFKWREVLVLALVLVLFSYLVFVKGLTLPFPMCPSFIENCPIR
jgi:putative tricarboxylic transport membrane protein